MFFNKYGQLGLYGIILSSIMTGIIIYKVNNICYSYNIKTYDNFLKSIVKNKNINIINYIINIFLLASFYIMIAGFSAYLKQEFNVPNVIGIILISVICYITFRNNVSGIINANTILVPFIIIAIIFLGIKGINLNSNIEFNNITMQSSIFTWFIDAILYSSYNSIMLIPILITLKEYVNSKKKNIYISIICSTFLLVLAVIIYFLLYIPSIDLNSIEMPLVYTATLLSNSYKYIYGISVLMAIYTTAIAAGYGFLENSTKTKSGYKYLTIIICVSSFIVARLGFSNLVNLLYPIFGYLGLIQIIFILKKKNSIEKKLQN